jgi:hypothetical protein
MIRGYAEQPSCTPGGALTLRVATDDPRFRVEFYRIGTDLVLHCRSPWLSGHKAPLHLPFQDWGTPGVGLRGELLASWPAYRFSIPPHWNSGVYLALLIGGDGTGRDLSPPDVATVDGRNGRALFVVKAAGETTSPILYKLPLLTYHAYNLGGDQVYDPTAGRGQWCLYNVPAPREVRRPILPAVNVHRPGGGTGATPYDTTNFDPFDPTPRQTFVHWDALFIKWLEDEGYAVDYCSDVDVHRDGAALLAPYQLLVSAGHDEYWTDPMRDAVESHIAAGRNVAFFSGNTAWWRVVFHDDHTFSRQEHWYDAGRPENAMTGVSFRNGGERDRNDHPRPVGYRVQHADHWIYAGTGVRDGDIFGGDTGYIVGYECDGAHFDRMALGRGRPVQPTGIDGAPSDFRILAVGDVQSSGWGIGNAAATMGLFTRHGSVFNAATTDWVRVLTSGADRVVEQITRNVLDRLGRR